MNAAGEVRASEEQFQILAEMARAAVFIYADGHIQWTNRAAQTITGYAADEMHALSFRDLIAAEDLETVTRNAAARLKGEPAPARYEFRLRRKDGELRWVDFSAALILYKGINAILGSAIDISACKQAEEISHKNEEIFRYVIESAIDVIAIISDDGTVKYTSPAVTRVMGYATEELVGSNAIGLIHPEDVTIALEGIRLGIEDYRNNPPIEVRVRHADGTYRLFEAASSHYFEGGERKGLACSFRPISDRKQAEIDLRESERKYRVLFKRNLAGVYVSRQDGRLLDCNDAAAKIFGYSSRHDLIHQNANLLYFSPDDRARFIAALRRDGSVSDFESRCRRADGSEVWILENAILFEPEPGAEPLVQGTLLDITERKRSEELQSALYRIASLTSSPIEPNEYYRSLHKILSELMYAENLYIAVLDKTGKKLQFRYFMDEVEQNPVERELRKGLSEYVIRTGKPLLADLNLCDQLEASGEVELLGAESLDWMGAPLLHGNEAIGLIAIQSYTEGDRYTAGDLEVLTFVAQHIGAAIERERSQQALRDSEQSHRSLIQSAVYGIYRASVDDRFLEVNPALVRMLGYETAEELLAVSLSEQIYEDPNDSKLLIERYQKDKRIENVETRWLRKDGRSITVQLSGRLLYNEQNDFSGFEMIVEDITERRALENQLRHSQKMEAVGRLAGGVAHDFNNLLTVIKGYSELALEQTGSNKELRTQVEEIGRAATRAGALTRQLLAFSRQQVLSPTVLDLNSVILGMEGMLKRLVGDEIRVHLIMDPKLGKLKADPSQIEQVIMNLAVNARDAIGAKGAITIETANIRGDDPSLSEPCGRQDQNFILLALRDTGSGMTDPVRSRIFEPFFTTKEIGKGTGLGLSTVYGVVQQSNGFISVESTPGQGTEFRILLPREGDGVDLTESSGVIPILNLYHRGTVLLVEDEDEVRSLVREVLQRRGFQILDARHPGEAILICERHEGEIDLLLTDVSLEQINGIELAERLSVLRPKMNVLYMSGYTPNGAQSGLLNRKNFLAKPFSADDLMQKIGEVFARGARSKTARI